MRAGLDSDAKKGMTLEKIGEKLGITKERVRQLNVRAMRKLRGLVEQQKRTVRCTSETSASRYEARTRMSVPLYMRRTEFLDIHYNAGGNRD